MNVKALLLILLVGIVIIAISAVVAGITYVVIRTAYSKSKTEYETIFNRIKGKMAGMVVERYQNQGMGGQLVIDFDDAIECVDEVAKEYDSLPFIQSKQNGGR